MGSRTGVVLTDTLIHSTRRSTSAFPDHGADIRVRSTIGVMVDEIITGFCNTFVSSKQLVDRVLEIFHQILMDLRVIKHICFTHLSSS